MGRPFSGDRRVRRPSSSTKQMYDAFVRVLEQRTATRKVEVVPGDVDLTFARFEKALDIGTQ